MLGAATKCMIGRVIALLPICAVAAGAGYQGADAREAKGGAALAEHADNAVCRIKPKTRNRTGNTMKISWFRQMISPEVGVRVAGYGMEDVSLSKWSDLYMTGLLMDDGTGKALLVSFDLQCLDVEYIRRFRKECGEILGIPPEAVMLTFTHTHGGPQTNTEAGYADHLNTEYLDFLEGKLLDECRKLADTSTRIECQVFFYSTAVDVNKNRRVVMADNYAAYLPYRAELRDVANGYADKELGCVLFYPLKSQFPAFVIGNYTAHPLAAHAPGNGGRRISADYPGVFCDYVNSETGATCMFVSGACGDNFPKKDELGSEGARRMGIELGEGVFRGMLDTRRNPERFLMKEVRVGALCRTLRVPLRPSFRDNKKLLPDRDLGKKEIDLEIQCLAIGDVCFVGVPGEWCAELGAEIKWHSAFRKAFIAFGATSYQEYMVPGNFLLQGGYEAQRHHFPGRYSIAMVKTAVDATYELRDQLYPLPEGAEEDSDTRVNQFSIVPETMPVHESFPFGKVDRGTGDTAKKVHSANR